MKFEWSIDFVLILVLPYLGDALLLFSGCIEAGRRDPTMINHTHWGQSINGRFTKPQLRHKREAKRARTASTLRAARRTGHHCRLRQRHDNPCRHSTGSLKLKSQWAALARQVTSMLKVTRSIQIKVTVGCDGPTSDEHK